MSVLRDIDQKKIIEHVDGLLLVVIALVLAFSASAVTIHRSFRTLEVEFGFGTGTAGVAYPVDSKIDKAIDEVRQKRNGLWAVNKPINPYEWRKAKRKM